VSSSELDTHPVQRSPSRLTEPGFADDETSNFVADVDAARRSNSKPEPEVKLMHTECDYVTESGDSGISGDVSGTYTSELLTQAKPLTKRNYFSIASLLELPP